jgi:hypothetical protein
LNEPSDVAKIISANRLADGIVVYAGYGGAWLEQLNQARIFASKEEAEAGLSLAQDDVARNLIVEPFVVDVTRDANGLRPSTLRYTIRAHGPTIDFWAHGCAITPDSISPRQNFSTLAAKPALLEALPTTCEPLDPTRGKPSMLLVSSTSSCNERRKNEPTEKLRAQGPGHRGEAI